MEWLEEWWYDRHDFDLDSGRCGGEAWEPSAPACQAWDILMGDLWPDLEDRAGALTRLPIGLSGLSSDVEALLLEDERHHKLDANGQLLGSVGTRITT